MICEARCTKRSSDAAYRLAKRQLSLYRRPVPIMSAENRMPSPPIPNPFMMNSESLPTWDLYCAQSWSLEPTPPRRSAKVSLRAGFLELAEPNVFNFNLPQQSPASIHSSPGPLEAGAVQPAPITSPTLSTEMARPMMGYDSDRSAIMRLSRSNTSSGLGDSRDFLGGFNDQAHSIPTQLATPDFQQIPLPNHTGHFSTF
jgi:hypothetical protein